MQTNIYKFSDLYNGVEIKNLTNNPDALYYTIDFDGKVFLQTHIPYVSGFQAITIDNVNQVINDHIASLSQ